MPIEPAEPTTRPSATDTLAVRRARARMTLAERHLTALTRDAVSSPSALVRTLAVAELDGATRALADAAARLADALGRQAEPAVEPETTVAPLGGGR